MYTELMYSALFLFYFSYFTLFLHYFILICILLYLNILKNTKQE